MEKVILYLLMANIGALVGLAVAMSKNFKDIYEELKELRKREK